MDYFGILKTAWENAWRNKTLWAFGVPNAVFSAVYLLIGLSPLLLLGGLDLSGPDGPDFAMPEITDGALALLVAVAAVLVLVAMAAWFFSYAAVGGLLHASNAVAEAGAVSSRDSWGAGLHRWGRTFMTQFVAFLPSQALMMVPIVVGAFVFGGALASGNEDVFLATLGVGSLVMTSLGGILYVAALVVTVVCGIVYQLAVCYGVLCDVTFGQGLKKGWADLRAKRGAFVFYLCVRLVLCVFSTVLSLVMLLFMVPSGVLFVLGQPGWAAVAFIAATIILLIPTPLWFAFVGSAWVIFFRRMTGMEPTALPAGVQPVSAPAPAPTPAPLSTPAPVPVPADA